MTAESWNVIIALGTFLVIAASAYAALLQLRHLNAGNQLNSLLFFLKLSRDHELREHFRFLHDEYPRLATDPDFLATLSQSPVDRSIHRELHVCVWYEEVAALLKHGLVNERIFLDMICPGVILRDWAAVQPTVSVLRAEGGPTIYMNFEYLAARSRKLMVDFPDGIYPANTPRLTVATPEHAERVRQSNGTASAFR